MKKLLLLFGFLISTSLLFGQASNNTPQPQVNPQDTLAVFTPLSAAGNTPYLTVATYYPQGYNGTNPGVRGVYAPKFFTVQATTTGSPTGCSFHVYGTLKLASDNPVYPTDYQDLTGALDCTGTTPANQFTSVYYKPASTLLVVLSTLSGGTTPSVQFRILVVH